MIRLVLILAFLAGPALGQPITCPNPGVIDGDTLACPGYRLRLWGIQAPERYDPAGPASTQTLARIVKGKTLVCIKRGMSWSRVVGQCWIGKTDVSAEMVRQGQAVDWPKFSKGAYAK